MKHCVVEDSSFIVATIDKTDPFHKDALYIFKQILSKTGKVKIIVPPLALYEVIVTLHRKGLAHKKIEEVVMNLRHIKDIIVLSITETSALKHCTRFLNQTNQATALRTADFMITCIGLDFEAQILTFDQKLWARVKPMYSSVYYCSSVGNMQDETGDFLTELNLRAL
jgi:predicted nucleic acid-binding protein